MKLAIIGSRNIPQVNIGSLVRECIGFEPTPSNLSIISGGAKGVDSYAENWCIANGIPIEVFKPNYKLHLRGAPIRRNEQMVRACDMVLAIWNGESKGTKYTIEYARKLGKPVHVFHP